MSIASGRRAFLVGGAAAIPALLSPYVTRAQQAMPVIGFLNGQSADGYGERLQAFRDGLKEAGYIEGENVAIDYQWANGQVDRLPAMAAELVRRHVTVIAAIGSSPPAFAAKAATTTIPVVFLMGEDPVRIGLVASLARPGANLTGVNLFNSELVAKRLGLLRELVPAARRVALLVDPSDHVNAETTTRDVEAAADALGQRIQRLDATTSREISEAFATFENDRPDALFISGAPFFNSRRVQLVQLAAHYRLPTTYGSRAYPDIGGLMSYGTHVTESYRQAGVYTGRILKGTRPADLPVMQSSKFELIINHQTARMLGIAVPPTLLATADEVIE